MFIKLQYPIPTRRIIELANFYKVNIDYMLKLSNVRENIKAPTNIDLKLADGFDVKKQKKLYKNPKELT